MKVQVEVTEYETLDYGRVAVVTPRNEVAVVAKVQRKSRWWRRDPAPVMEVMTVKRIIFKGEDVTYEGE